MRTPEGPDAAEWLRRAAAVLQEQLREVPHGPWRWADPEVGSGLPVDSDQLELDQGRAGGLGRAHPSGLGVPPVPGRTDLTTTFPPPTPTIEDVVRPARSRAPVGPQPARGVAPAIAEPLATLLSQLSRRIEQGDRSGPGSDEDVERAAVEVAKAIIELGSPASPGPWSR